MLNIDAHELENYKKIPYIRDISPRNGLIASSVLNGESYLVVGMENEISKQRVAIIVNRVLMSVNLKEYEAHQNKIGRERIKAYRDIKDSFLSEIEPLLRCEISTDQ